MTKRLIAAAAMLLAASAAPAQVTQANLLDRIQIEDLLYEYYGGLDDNTPHDFAAYFTDDAMLDVNGKVANGRKEIQALYDNYATFSPGEALPGRLHVMLSNPRIKVTGDRATAKMIWTEVNSDSIKAAPRVVEQGTEETELRKVGGRWLMTKRVITNSGGLPDAYDGLRKPAQP